ncbi:MAG: trimethylamine methyltransferase family protein [Rhizobiales bacterium]|nr:trimethylamine methyltransferase family protein [Hyphomicrobiales bacterium]
MRRGAARSERTKTPTTDARSPDRGLHSAATRPYQPLHAEGVKTLIEAAISLLADSGVVFDPETEAAEIFSRAGCATTQDGIVRIPPTLVHQALCTAARSATTRAWSGSSSPTSCRRSFTGRQPAFTSIPWTRA